MKIELEDQMAEDGKQTIRIETDLNNVFIKPEGYGDFCSTKGEGTPVLIERFNGVLRVVIWGDINQEDPTHTISLEGARESEAAEWLRERNKIKDSYPNGVCPDCQEEIPNNVKEGQVCTNCGHAFYEEKDEEEERRDEKRGLYPQHDDPAN
jgi:hypothetical protein